jgi:hypothetical protein
MILLTLLLLLCGISGWGQIARPVVGVVVDQNRDARLVSGVAASATLGEPLLNGVLALACTSELSCLAKTETTLYSTGGAAMEGQAGSALLSMNQAGTYAYLLESRQLLRLEGGTWQTVEFAAPGDLLALRANGDGFDYAVLREDGIAREHFSISEARVTTSGELPLAERILLLADGALLVRDGQLGLRHRDGSEQAFDVVGVLDLLAIGDHSVEIITSEALWLLDVEQGQLTLLPGVAR